MKKFYPFLIFLLSFPVFLYLSLPIERFVEGELCKRGISYGKVEVERFPPKVEVKKLSLLSLPFSIEEVEIFPEISSIFSGSKRLKISLKACSGEGEIELDYPVSSLEFFLESLNVAKCVKELPVKVEGLLSLSGKFRLDAEKKLLKGGRGSFSLQNVKVGELSFGLFSIPGLNLGKVEGTFTVKRENVVSLEAKGAGRDAEISVKGYINVDLRIPKRSYLNLKVKVKPKVAPLKGRTFSFRIKGFAENVTVAR
ncbi:hypothetical protein [Phorcysia thermohydrogeniphila]|uniref:Type II secretion system protein N n=1 Tax=Phorcysia thermohydrogeniphila TaxID=936138 RepID=A0A4R1G913_9BACT|nr:hypothetical protein [Phorcysia thermohydrogeniphila]TCK04637.1 type II secretion system protein N [Phorcysia thermohydrogeniphila]